MGRWFALDGFALHYFDSKTDKSSKGSVDLSRVGVGFVLTTVDAGAGKKAPPTPHTLSLITEDRRWQMCFKSDVDLAVWKAWFLELEEALFGAGLGWRFHSARLVGREVVCRG